MLPECEHTSRDLVRRARRDLLDEQGGCSHDRDPDTLVCRLCGAQPCVHDWRNVGPTYGEHARMEALGVDCRDGCIDLFCWQCGATIARTPKRVEDTLTLAPEMMQLGGAGAGFYDCPWRIFSWDDGTDHPVAKAIIRAETEPDPDDYRERVPIPNRHRRKDLLIVNILAYLQEHFEYVSIRQMEWEASRWVAHLPDSILRPGSSLNVWLGRPKYIRGVLEKLIRAGLAEAKPDRRGVPQYRLLDPGLPSVKKCRRCRRYVERTKFAESGLGWCNECWRR